jgi:hypothetical protein
MDHSHGGFRGSTHVDNKFDRAIDALPGLVWGALPDGRAYFLNRCWREYTGVDVSQPLDAEWQAAIHPEDLPQWVERWRSTEHVARAVGAGGSTATLRRHVSLVPLPRLPRDRRTRPRQSIDASSTHSTRRGTAHLTGTPSTA